MAPTTKGDLDLAIDADELTGLDFYEIADLIAGNADNGNLQAWRTFLEEYADETPPARWSKVQVIQRALSACVEEFV